ncbi:MAG: hypothetical protein CMH83_15725 [Nocardioides sp.]|nr:hypothetical protein [Nocardioides sp.]
MSTARERRSSRVPRHRDVGRAKVRPRARLVAAVLLAVVVVSGVGVLLSRTGAGPGDAARAYSFASARYDCDGFQASTTESLRERLDQGPCAQGVSGIGLRSVYALRVEVERVVEDGDSATVRTYETWTTPDDAPGAQPGDHTGRYVYLVKRVDGTWLVDRSYIVELDGTTIDRDLDPEIQAELDSVDG